MRVFQTKYLFVWLKKSKPSYQTERKHSMPAWSLAFTHSDLTSLGIRVILMNCNILSFAPKNNETLRRFAAWYRLIVKIIFFITKAFLLTLATLIIHMSQVWMFSTITSCWLHLYFICKQTHLPFVSLDERATRGEQKVKLEKGHYGKRQDVLS